MAHFAILDTNIGVVHWIGEASDADAALDKLEEDVGGGDAWDRKQFSVYEVHAWYIPEIEAWIADGHPSRDTPACFSDREWPPGLC